MAVAKCFSRSRIDLTLIAGPGPMETHRVKRSRTFMDAQALHTSISAGAVAACAECGTVSRDRQYVRVRDRHTCEHCLLDARKRLGGLKHDPYELFVESLAEALDLRERETGLHSKRVAANTLLLATHHFQKPSDLKEVYWGSLLHDIGKIGVPDAILLKAGQLTEQEWQIMREHPYNGHLILQKLSFLSMAANIVLCHEERFDGSGYPAGSRVNRSRSRPGSLP